MNMAVLADRVKFRDYPDGKRRGSLDGLDSAYAPAVHVKASALAGDLGCPPSWPPQESQQLSDPRLTSADRPGDGMSTSPAADSSPAAAEQVQPLARSDSDASPVSATSRHSSQLEDSELNDNEQAGMALLGTAHHSSAQ